MRDSVSSAGRKPPMVMIHGAFCGGWAFEKFQTVFEAAGFDVHCPTLRHHDRAGGGGVLTDLGTVSLLDYVQDLTAYIACLEGPPVLVGHSMGGLLCQLLAAKGLGSAAILLAPSAPYGVLPSTAEEVVAAHALFWTGPFWARPLVPGYSLTVEHALDRLPPAEQSQILSRLVPESGQAMFEVLHWAADPKQASRAHARDVRCPVLCVAGSDDRINPPATVRRIAHRYRGRYVTVDGFSHWLIGEPGWQVVAQLCLDWLAADAKG